MDAVVFLNYTLKVVVVNLFAVTSVTPDYAQGEGGTRITVFGEGLSYYNGTQCRFGTGTTSPATFIRTNVLECVAPWSPTDGTEVCKGLC